MRPTRPRPTTAFAALVALLSVLGLAAPAMAADGDTWTIATASNDLGHGRQNYTYALDPGGELKDGLTIDNPGSTPLHLSVYAADAFTGDGGQLDLRTKDAEQKGLGAWIRPEQPDVTVQPGASAEVPFTLTVPEGAAPGDYMGGIVTTPAEGDGSQRRGIRVWLRVGGTLEPRLSVQDVRVDYTGTANPLGAGEATVTYTVRNTGNAIVSARQQVSLSGPFDSLTVNAGEVADTPELLPGDQWKVSVPVSGVAPALRLTGTVHVVPLLTDAANSITPLAPVVTTAYAWTIPWAVVAVLIVVCALIGYAVRRRRRA